MRKNKLHIERHSEKQLACALQKCHMLPMQAAWTWWSHVPHSATKTSMSQKSNEGWGAVLINEN